MSRTSPHHEVLTNGEGKCSVPMFSTYGDAGFCDRPAYGERPPGLTRTRWDGFQYRDDGRYAGYVPALACPGHGGPTLDSFAIPGGSVYRDGDKWCSVGPGFINMQESDAGFGDTPADATAALVAMSAKEPE